jgi:hypothetical protein
MPGGPPDRATHECAVDDCGAEIPTSLLMCRTHWFRVPSPVRERVNVGFRAYRRGGPDALVADYWAAREEAIQIAAGGGL